MLRDPAHARGWNSYTMSMSRSHVPSPLCKLKHVGWHLAPAALHCSDNPQDSTTVRFTQLLFEDNVPGLRLYLCTYVRMYTYMYTFSRKHHASEAQHAWIMTTPPSKSKRYASNPILLLEPMLDGFKGTQKTHFVCP